jgi:hypothetical protein
MVIESMEIGTGSIHYSTGSPDTMTTVLRDITYGGLIESPDAV